VLFRFTISRLPGRLNELNRPGYLAGRTLAENSPINVALRSKRSSPAWASRPFALSRDAMTTVLFGSAAMNRAQLLECPLFGPVTAHLEVAFTCDENLDSSPSLRSRALDIRITPTG
jgi:hypothetical protein